jgi:hypothetical protein
MEGRKMGEVLVVTYASGGMLEVIHTELNSYGLVYGRVRAVCMRLCVGMK